MLTVDDHPLLDAGAFATTLPEGLLAAESPAWLTSLFQLEVEVPLERSEEVRKEVRDLLRHGGYKPTGRGKPASEYLIRAAKAGVLSSVNAAVDACNVVSLHSGLPISVVDLDRVEAPLGIRIAGEGAEYVFNKSGQTIKLAGLLCLFDSAGPCANGVKDCQRTKTDPDTRRTLSVVWGTSRLGDRTRETTRWYRDLLERLGAETSDVL